MAKLTASQDISDFLATADDAEARASLGIVGSSLTLVANASNVVSSHPLLTIPNNWKAGQSTLSGLQIGSSVTSIGSYAFNYCVGLTGALIIPSSVTSIGDNAFQSCVGFTGIFKIGNSVTSVGSYSFAYCNNLTGELTIPSSVLTIGQNAFRACSSLVGPLVIPNSVTTIGANAFRSCGGISSANIFIAKTIIDAATNCFLNNSISAIHVRASDETWTAGAGQTIGGQTDITVIKDL